MYTDQDRYDDFEYFVDNYDELFKQYGYCYLAIKNKNILGSFSSLSDAINELSPIHPLGTYILQECSGSRDSYIVHMMRFRISEIPA